jgi:hypothetical protein
MAEDTLTLALEGQVPLELFGRSMQSFSDLVQALSKEVADDAAVEWLVDALEVGSAVATVRGTCADPTVVPRVADAFLVVGQALAENRRVPYSNRVSSAATALTEVLDGHITSLRFVVGEREATVASTGEVEELRETRLAWGVVTGRVNTLTDRGRLRFTLYDSLFDQAVSCLFTADHEGLMRDAWRRRVRISGRVKRDPVSGRPTEIRDIREVEVLPDARDDGLALVRGIAPAPSGSEEPEDTIRRMRDAG